MRRYSFCFLLLVLMACQDNEADAPELRTKPALQIGSSGAVLDAELTQTGPIVPVSVGFLWGTTQDLTIATAPGQHVIGDMSKIGPFSINVATLSPSTKYYFRAFAAKKDFTEFYYGPILDFTTLP